ncbi:MAG: hypothetical protein ACLP4W_17870 [Mycobacterium sp.]|uniref:hypothetical protein n=1 Tax=Mycobacterium sp. TaxID=1785 RepID=UPI003F96DF9B
MTADDARTWRDLADQLTPEQIAFYEKAEREVREKTGESADAFWLLDCARHDAESNMIKNVMDIDPPPDAELPAFGDVQNGRLVMTFEGTKRHVLDIGVGNAEVPELPDDEYPPTTASVDVDLVIIGQQYSDGTADRSILVVPLTSDDEPDFVPGDCTYCVSLDEAELDADGARRLGQALIDAADELDQLSDPESAAD